MPPSPSLGILLLHTDIYLEYVVRLFLLVKEDRHADGYIEVLNFLVSA